VGEGERERRGKSFLPLQKKGAPPSRKGGKREVLSVANDKGNFTLCVKSQRGVSNPLKEKRNSSTQNFIPFKGLRGGW